ncbi:uncharacterized protein M421DRAFT_422061 [Didymella exigua CBS 183.55]|uniref:Uncharacterized protein n=1 Tax=Didymella exigua CBS 183.55 TaxID=1150837 RepID=A0A6A5RJP8_9PLEO|nr:uncharacterized protein M421DRAFT_422061 [Didymella exigua CBS 183.55]KAF1927204.1 hypothetical protein M421DRAFT_422061 [Didymella exigua CBS 183.55]
MVPKPTGWFKSNKSHTSVDISSGQPSPVPSVNNEFPNPNGQQQAQLGQQPPLQQPSLGVAQQQQQQQYCPPQQQPYPQRTTSTSHNHRLSSHDQLQGYQQQGGPPSPSPAFDQPRPSSQQLTDPVYVQEQPKKLSRLSRIAAGLTGHKEEDASKHSKKDSVGRRQSTRGKENRPLEHQQQQQQDAPRLNTPSQQYQQRAGSQQQLPTSVEQDEGSPGLDPFLQQDSNTPEVPPKDLQYQQHPQQFGSKPLQGQYNRSPLDRVSTEGSYQKQSGVEHYSPDQHQGPQLQQQQANQHQYQNYQPVTQQAQTSDAYQSFPPQSAPSPRPGNAQQYSQDLSKQQRNAYYQQQQAAQQSQGQSPQDGHLQNNQFQQQQHFAPPPQSQPQQTQDFRQQQAHPVRAASLHQPELQHPQATRGVPQIVQGGQPVDQQQLQQLRPPSSQQQAPPSPLQHQYQPYDQQHNQQSQVSDSPTSKISLQNQSQDSMAPSSQSNGRLRKVAVDGGQQQSTTSSRESSLLQQPTAQGQPQGQPPVSPGVATFGANVVPTASQGQPYRGDKQSGETGHATPPPRSAASDLSEEDIEKMMKEHDVLRDKYQKVKRYFFEQQTQVHQLQNTLANQRLSLSRTSWDDSEYATRFNRLDGLIAQLSFSIRKDWKSIPLFLHPVVNKNAVEIGKQEMTAVGRAFISHWLVENIFERYFHPDLEPGFSTQLQMIQLNIRKFAPSCHSTEDEDSLAAKVINWRLATLEGLSDLLRAPQAETNRQKLTETLNEKLIASLQLHLIEPAPPDLAGGVPMMVELAVSIAQHLPLESREVHIEYFPPGHSIVSELMKMESGIPPLTSPIKEVDEADRASLKSVASKLDDSTSADQDMQGPQPLKEDKKRGFFGGLGASKKPTTAPASLGKRESSLGQGGSQQSLTGPPGSSSGQKDEPPPPRVRLAVGVAVQIRGKTVLSKAPVYST